MRSLYIITAIMLSTTLCFAQKKKNSPATANKQHVVTSPVKEKADIMAKAFLSGDYDSYVQFTYPKSMTTQERGQLSQNLERQMIGMRSAGSGIINITFGTPTAIIKNDTLWQCTIPEETVTKITQGQVKSQTTLIAVSYDQGKQWYFMDAADRKIEAITKLYPELSNELYIAPPTQPKFELNNQ